MSGSEDDFAAHAPLVVVSGQLVGEHRLPVAFAVRREPNNEFDSGWNFLSGYELPKYLDDPNNLHICPLKIFLEEDPSLREIMDAAVGTSWERIDDPLLGDAVVKVDSSGDVSRTTRAAVWRIVETKG